MDLEDSLPKVPSRLTTLWLALNGILKLPINAVSVLQLVRYDALFSTLPDSARPAVFKGSYMLHLLETGVFAAWLDGDDVFVPAPEELHVNDRDQLHRTDGPAVVWGGMTSHYVNGVRLGAEWFRPDHPSQLPENLEARRAVCELLGWERVLDMIGARRVQRDDFGELLEADLQDETPRLSQRWIRPGDSITAEPSFLNFALARFCRVRCPSSDRQYLIRVPPETRTCLEGLAWAAQVEPEEYLFKLET